MIGVELCPTCKENVRKAKAARRAKRLARSLPRRKAEAVKRSERNDETRVLRNRVCRLAKGECERCETPLLDAEGQMHHTEGGGGRVERQHVGNVAWICDLCHRFLHQQPRLAREFRIEIREKRERTGER